MREPEPNLNLENGAQVTRTKPEPLKYFEQELNLNPNRYLKRFDTLLVIVITYYSIASVERLFSVTILQHNSETPLH